MPIGTAVFKWLRAIDRFTPHHFYVFEPLSIFEQEQKFNLFNSGQSDNSGLSSEAFYEYINQMSNQNWC